MGSHYEPPAPEIEAEVALSAYRRRLRAAETRDRLEVNADGRPPVARPSNLDRLRQSAMAIVTKIVRLGRSRKKQAP